MWSDTAEFKMEILILLKRALSDQAFEIKLALNLGVLIISSLIDPFQIIFLHVRIC